MTIARLGAAVTAVAIAVVGLPATLHAADFSVVVRGQPLPSIAVRFADLNLASDEGVDRLNGRIRHAAGLLCSYPGRQPGSALNEGRDCRDEAMGAAQPQVQRAISGFRSGAYAAAAVAPITVSLR